MIVFVRRILLEDKRWLRSEDENCRFESELTRDTLDRAANRGTQAIHLAFADATVYTDLAGLKALKFSHA